MQTLSSLLTLTDNPVFHRYRRSQLRLKSAAFWYLSTLIITSFVVSLGYIVQTNSGISEQFAARSQWMPLLVLQGFIVLIKGTGRTSAGLIQDKIDQTLDYQRLTPVSPLRNVVGYLFGLPILEYVMFALTLPHLAFVVIKGNIPPATVFSVYLVFFVCALFYHMTAVAIGMVMKRWIWGYLLSIFAVACLNLMLVPLGAVFGLKFMQYLSVFPVIGEKVQPLVVPQGPEDLPEFVRQGLGPPQGGFGPPQPVFPSGPGGASSDPVFSFAEPVPFFEWTLSPIVFTLLLQTGLILTMATMALRRWEKADKHSLSKPYALGVLAAVILLVIGNLWPVITRQDLPFPFFGQGNLEVLAGPIAVLLPLIFTVLIFVLCTVLFAIVVPAHHAYVRGVRRARKLGLSAARPWDDDAANLGFMSLFVVLALIGYGALFFEMSAAGYMDFLEGTRYQAWRLPLALALLLINTYLVLQVLELRGTVLTVLLLWLLPVLVAIVTAAAMERMTQLHTVFASLSPLATLLMTGILPFEQGVPADPDFQFDAFFTGSTTGLIFVAAQSALLVLLWRKLRKTLR